MFEIILKEDLEKHVNEDRKKEKLRIEEEAVHDAQLEEEKRRIDHGRQKLIRFKQVKTSEMSDKERRNSDFRFKIEISNKDRRLSALKKSNIPRASTPENKRRKSHAVIMHEKDTIHEEESSYSI